MDHFEPTPKFWREISRGELIRSCTQLRRMVMFWFLMALLGWVVALWRVLP